MDNVPNFYTNLVPIYHFTYSGEGSELLPDTVVVKDLMDDALAAA